MSVSVMFVKLNLFSDKFSDEKIDQIFLIGFPQNKEKGIMYSIIVLLDSERPRHITMKGILS